MKPLSLQTSDNLAPLSGNSLVLGFVELSAGAARWDNDLLLILREICTSSSNITQNSQFNY